MVETSKIENTKAGKVSVLGCRCMREAVWSYWRGDVGGDRPTRKSSRQPECNPVGRREP